MRHGIQVAPCRPNMQGGTFLDLGTAMDRVDYQTIIIQDVVNLERRHELNLRPWYQRRIVWTPQQQSYLINTIHEQKPIPSIYIRHSIDVGPKPEHPGSR